MMAGLLRWPTLHWSLAQAWDAASPTSREGIAATFDNANLSLGNVIGEFLGELFLRQPKRVDERARLLPPTWVVQKRSGTEFH